MSKLGQIRELWRYPVSSMGGERLDAVKLRPGGVEGDRIWAVADAQSGEVAGPERRKQWRALPSLPARLPSGASVPQVGDGEGGFLDADSEAARLALSRFLGFDAVLAPQIPFATQKDGEIAPRYRRGDILLVTTSAMATLANLLDNAADADMRRFRPNIVVDTQALHSGFAEFALVGRELAVGAARLRVVEPCVRCPFVALGQNDLAFDPGVLHAVTEYAEGNFGVLCDVIFDGPARIGDPVWIAG
jgi:uncharacterized protein YcbX